MKNETRVELSAEQKLEMAMEELRMAAAERRAAIIAPSQALLIVNFIRRLELTQP